MSAGWSAVNLAIVMGSRRSRKPVERRSLREFLFLNLGLNVAYIGVGVCLAWLGPPGVAGSGWAVAVHGAALLALDGWLLSEVPPQDATPEP